MVLKLTIGDNSFAYVLDTKEIPADPITGTPVYSECFRK